LMFWNGRVRTSLTAKLRSGRLKMFMILAPLNIWPYSDSGGEILDWESFPVPRPLQAHIITSRLIPLTPTLTPKHTDFPILQCFYQSRTTRTPLC
jgi:hypothetical protein